MRHLKNSRRLGRMTSHRKAMFRNMATSLLDKSRIETTEVKAKELRHYVERMITLGKRGDLHARRQALAFLRSKDVVSKVFGEYAERFKDRPGGYTRIMKIGNRVGDNARMAIIELVDDKGPKAKDKGKVKKEGKAKDSAAAKPEKKTTKTQAKEKEPKKTVKKPESEEDKTSEKTKTDPTDE